MDDMFLLMCEKNKKILNIMIKRNIYVLDSTLNVMLKKFPKTIEFENKRLYFKT